MLYLDYICGAQCRRGFRFEEICYLATWDQREGIFRIEFWRGIQFRFRAEKSKIFRFAEKMKVFNLGAIFGISSAEKISVFRFWLIFRLTDTEKISVSVRFGCDSVQFRLENFRSKNEPKIYLFLSKTRKSSRNRNLRFFGFGFSVFEVVNSKANFMGSFVFWLFGLGFLLITLFWC